MQANRMTQWTKLQWAQCECMVFNKVEDVWQRPHVTHLASNGQLTDLACEMSHNNHF